VKVSLLTDAPKHNLALMKLSAWHKASGDDILLNMPLWKADISYASVLFKKNKKMFRANAYGGPAFNGARLNKSVDIIMPDYDLYGLDFSLGYTWSYCPRKCGFCKVPEQHNPKIHYSIWNFHNPEFKKICLLNNNTFSDPQWKETFEEIWDAGLTVIDENGYDIRLLDDEKADALHKTKWATPIHFAWDYIDDETKIIRGLKLLEKHKLKSTRNGVYVLIGYRSTMEEDIHRCQVIDDYGLTPYPMPFVKTAYTKAFKRFINLHYYRKYKTIKEAWSDYRR
jgi:hypothetical protein